MFYGWTNGRTRYSDPIISQSSIFSTDMKYRLKCLRGVRDKLPRGRYVVMVSMYNRLGGNVLRWSNLKGQQWSGATLPVPHGGRFFDVEIKVAI